MDKLLPQLTPDPIRTLFCAAFFLLIAGCSTKPPVGTVTGEVTFEGKPVEDGRITLIPVDGKSQPAGDVIKDGKYEIKNAPVGSMKVEVNGNKKTGRKIKAYDTPESPVSDEIVEPIPPRYNVNSELTLDVKPGPQRVPYDLKK